MSHCHDDLSTDSNGVSRIQAISFLFICIAK